MIEVSSGGVDGLTVEAIGGSCTHDNAGNVTSIADSATTPGATDTQCFVYDSLRRLSEAWALRVPINHPRRSRS
jgi:hypothetical protein